MSGNNAFFKPPHVNHLTQSQSFTSEEFRFWLIASASQRAIIYLVRSQKGNHNDGMVHSLSTLYDFLLNVNLHNFYRCAAHSVNIIWPFQICSRMVWKMRNITMKKSIKYVVPMPGTTFPYSELRGFNRSLMGVRNPRGPVPWRSLSSVVRLTVTCRLLTPDLLGREGATSLLVEATFPFKALD